MLLLLLLGALSGATAASIRFATGDEPAERRPLPWAAKELQHALRTQGISAAVEPAAATTGIAVSGNTITLLASPAEAAVALPFGSPPLGREGFQLLHRGGGEIVVAAASGAGAMYGALDLAERIAAAATSPNCSLLLGSVGAAAHGHRVADARFGYRAIKINLPWSPYRSGAATELHMPGARSLEFWEALLDHLARSRFNTLSIWSEHPFPFMIRAKNFPNATVFNDTELAAWKALHTGIFRLARDRAIEPALVDWNVFVSQGFKAHYDPTAHADTDGGSGPATITPLANQYNRESITQTLQEYPDLAGIGLSLGDRVSNLNLSQQLQWAQEVVIGGIQAAGRPVRVIYRAPFGEGKAVHDPTPAVARAAIEASGVAAEDLFVQIKFNWSHGHSLVKLVHVHGGGVGEAYYTPPSTKYKVTWMVRNEDFFFLRWAGPAFVRAHIAANGHDYVGGYCIGSEGLIPAIEYAEKPASQSWRWMFEKQWLFYTVWGRLLFDPTTPDASFAAAFEQRYSLVGSGDGARMVQAFELVSIVPLRICAFVYNTWDFTLHAEGFLMVANNPDKEAQGFISVETLLQSKTLDPSMQAIASFVQQPNATLTSPLQLATELTNASQRALALLSAQPALPAALSGEAGDVLSWAHLGLYFAAKLQGTVALARFRSGGGASWQAAATKHLTDARDEWAALVKSTAHLRSEIPLDDLESSARKNFSWAAYSPMVQRDLDLVDACGQAETKLCPGLHTKGAPCRACVKKNSHQLKDAHCWPSGGEGDFIAEFCGK